MNNSSEKDYFESLISLEYTHTAGSATTRFLEAVAEGKIVGQKCPSALRYMFLQEEVVQEMVYQLQRRLLLQIEVA